MQKLLGTESGLEVARQLFTDWSRWATGGSGTDSAHPGTVIEVLSADDERYGDDNISNGTPHDCAICQGFWAHHLPCPAVLLEGDNCDGDGVPDRCSGDCNENATPDACDVFAATSTDCDSDGVPDECSGDCNDNAIYDACDIDVGTSEDCDGDGTPDECESDADCNANAVPDRCDVAGGTSRDCDASGVPDECEVSAGTSADCNENGTPDGCEPDCNASGFPDDCDVTAGTSADCGGDGVPDECTAADCNANSVPDECDIASGTAEDCNGNRVPDTCDLTGGTSGDCPAAAGNGVPDECEPDCNRNGTADSCDLATESSPDCDGNGTPDECDLASCRAHDCNGNGNLDGCDIAEGTSADGNEDGVPDECAVPPVIMTVTSVGHHKEFGDWGGGEVELCVDPELGAIEPRIQFPIAANDNTWLFLRVTFDQEVNADSLTAAGVVPDPGLDADITQPAGSPETVEIRFKDAGVLAAVPAGSYTVNVAGLAASDDGTRAGGACATFRICYATGDVNCDGRATLLDWDAVLALNLKDLSEDEANPRADLNRNGVFESFDRAIVDPLFLSLPRFPAVCSCSCASADDCGCREADFDRDQDVDLEDYSHFQVCFGAASSLCLCTFDLEPSGGDGDVDLTDYSDGFLGMLGEPGNCGNSTLARSETTGNDTGALLLGSVSLGEATVEYGDSGLEMSKVPQNREGVDPWSYVHGDVMIELQPFGGGSSQTVVFAGVGYEIHFGGVAQPVDGYTLLVSAGGGCAIAAAGPASNGSWAQTSLFEHSAVSYDGDILQGGVACERVESEIVMDDLVNAPGGDGESYLSNIILFAAADVQIRAILTYTDDDHRTLYESNGAVSFVVLPTDANGED